MVSLLLLCLLYAVAVLLARRYKPEETLPSYRILAFVSAIILIALVLLTPLDTIARTQLFAAHMIQAVTLTTLCAPLLLAACPDWLLQPLIDQPVGRQIFRFLTQPLIASLIFNLTFLTWHAPNLYNLALNNSTLYQVEMLSFLLTSLLNWWPLIGPLRRLRNLSYPLQMVYAFFDGQPVDIYAFLLVFTGVVFYTHYAIPHQFIEWGYSAVADQTIAGAFLLIPGLVDLVVMSPLFFRWLGQIEQQSKIADQRRQEEEEAEAARHAAELAEAETSEAEA
ncbi:MAG TPA: cytochrome c oxidase assembly protein [Ktedonobacteraceae bacterium]|nr:cytochrome c oxidase assembly protein [Ktedonobacteraceae bacterium]